MPAIHHTRLFSSPLGRQYMLALSLRLLSELKLPPAPKKKEEAPLTEEEKRFKKTFSYIKAHFNTAHQKGIAYVAAGLLGLDPGKMYKQEVGRDGDDDARIKDGYLYFKGGFVQVGAMITMLPSQGRQSDVPLGSVILVAERSTNPYCFSFTNKGQHLKLGCWTGDTARIRTGEVWRPSTREEIIKFYEAVATHEQDPLSEMATYSEHKLRGLLFEIKKMGPKDLAIINNAPAPVAPASKKAAAKKRVRK
jgi:hypothetical protein